MHQRPTLDCSSFERLLAAAWILQCQRDQEVCHRPELTEAKPDFAAAGKLTITMAADEISPAEAAQNATKSASGPSSIEDNAVSWPVAREQWELGTASIAQQTWHASQALSPLSCEVSATPSIALNFPQSLRELVQGSIETPSHLLSTPGSPTLKASAPNGYGLLLLLSKEVLAEGLEHALLASARIAEVAGDALRFLVSHRFKIKVTLNRRRAALAAWAPLAIVLIVAGFTVFQVWHQGHVHVVAATTGMDPSESRRNDLSRLIPPALASHRQITDHATFSVVQGLSRYEIPALRRQAYYGDDSAALVMGMLYETGRFVPQSCTKAAEWVTLSANWGNAAAQYNLGLRYRDGDGVVPNQDEAKEWLQKAADHRYSNATIALGRLVSRGAGSTYAP